MSVRDEEPGPHNTTSKILTSYVFIFKFLGRTEKDNGLQMSARECVPDIQSLLNLIVNIIFILKLWFSVPHSLL